MRNNKPWTTPIAYSIYTITGILLLVGLSFNLSPVEVLRHVFIPYSIDFSHGFGKDISNLLRLSFIAAQLLICTLIYKSLPDKKSSRIVASALGVLLILLYSMTVVGAFFANNFH